MSRRPLISYAAKIIVEVVEVEEAGECEMLAFGPSVIRRAPPGVAPAGGALPFAAHHPDTHTMRRQTNIKKKV